MNKYILLWFLLNINLYSFSQNLGKIDGRVIDFETGLALEGATIKIEETNFFAYTDEKGNFQILDIPKASYNITAKLYWL